MPGQGTTYYTHAKTYLPDAKAILNGWESDFAMRDNGGMPACINVALYDINGKVVDARTCLSVSSNATWVADASSMAHDWLIENYSFSGPAMVYANQNVGVVVVNDNNSKAYAYEGIPSPPSVSGIGVGTEIFVPSYMRDYYGWYSTVYAQNTGGASTIIYAYLYNGSGQQVGSAGSFVNPGGRASFGSLTGTNIGSVGVTADQPLAVTAFHEYPNEASAYACFAISGTVGYPVPLMKNFYGWYSSYVAQETTDQAVTAQADYYPSNNVAHTLNLSAWGQQTVWMGGESGLPSSWVGSARAWVTGGSGRMAMAVHSASSTGATAHPVAQAGARNLFVPYLRRGDGWDTSLTVQNVGTGSTGVTVYFYHTDGTSAGYFAFPTPLDRWYSRVVYNELPNGTTSAWVYSADADVIAVVHQSNTSGRAIDYAVP